MIKPERLEKLNELEKKIKINFKDKKFLRQALVHRSYLNENAGFDIPHNERMEFLGDAVLELVVSSYLFSNFPNPEGDMTAWRAALVNTKMLAKISNRLDFGDYLLLSQGEAKDKGRARESILANTMESVIGAIYLDQGYEAASGWRGGCHFSDR